MTVDYDKIGLRISQRRHELKMKQNYLAEVTDLSNNHISVSYTHLTLPTTPYV